MKKTKATELYNMWKRVIDTPTSQGKLPKIYAVISCVFNGKEGKVGAKNYDEFLKILMWMRRVNEDAIGTKNLYDKITIVFIHNPK